MRAILTLFAVATMAALAADPWKTKKPEEWTEKETAQILNDSPWAKKVTAEMGFGGMGGPDGGMGGPGGGMGGRGGGMGGPPGGGMGGPPGGGMGGPGGGMEARKITVRWDSAEPVRGALNRLESVAAGKLEEWTKNFYVVSTSGPSMMRPGGRGPGGQSGPPAMDPSRMEQMQQRMRESTSLKPKGKAPIAPERVEFVESAGAMLTFYLFPRSAQISPEDKEVTFETSLGPMAIKAKFTLKDMQYQGKFAL